MQYQEVWTRMEWIRRTKSLAEEIIGGAIAVHGIFGPGFPESIYEEAPCIELVRRSIPTLPDFLSS